MTAAPLSVDIGEKMQYFKSFF